MYWSPVNYKLAGRRTGVASVGKPVRLVYKFRTRKFKYDDYTGTNFLTQGVFPDKTYFLIVKADGELGQICGVKSAANQPILGEVNSNYIVKVTTFYRYRWVAGAANQKPTIYGSNLGTNESVSEDALCWTSVPSLKATRFAAGLDTTTLTSFGALDAFSKHQTTLNPPEDCAGDQYVPTVAVAP